MKAGFIRSLSLLMAVFLSSCQDKPQAANSVTVAVASNFMATARALSLTYTAETGTDVTLVSGSTGKLSAQIQQGAPFHVFLSADTAAPRYLAEQGFGVEKTRFSYALGQLALHSSQPDLVHPEEGFPHPDRIRHLAIANPELAPYGRAARETLISLGQWEAVQRKIVRGENIAQTWHFVSSGNADLGFVATSQLQGKTGGSTWLVPHNLHSPIEQDAILIHDTPEARQFLAHLRKPASRDLIQSHGYDLPPPSHAE